jgi:hypothetical protein
MRLFRDISSPHNSITQKRRIMTALVVAAASVPLEVVFLGGLVALTNGVRVFASRPPTGISQVSTLMRPGYRLLSKRQWCDGARFRGFISSKCGGPATDCAAWPSLLLPAEAADGAAAERVGASIRVRTLPTGRENPDQQTDRAARTASANRGRDRTADMPNLRQEADAR